jgi:hypothetical protein
MRDKEKKYHQVMEWMEGIPIDDEKGKSSGGGNGGGSGASTTERG